MEDIETHTEWMADAVAITFRTEQHTGVGTEFDCLTRVGPFTTTDVMTVTEWDPGVVMGIEHRGVVTGRGRFTLHALPGELTELCWDEELRFPWWMGGPVGERTSRPVFTRLWRANLAASAQSRVRSWRHCSDVATKWRQIEQGGVSGRGRWPCRGRARGSWRRRSRASSVPNTSTNASASTSSPRASEPSSPSSIACLASPIATTAPDASSRRPRERLRPRARRPGTTRSTSPIASASSARTCRPLQISSFARAGPTSAGSRCVPPAPGMIPSRISG